jgi:hypothetical protein
MHARIYYKDAQVYTYTTFVPMNKINKFSQKLKFTKLIKHKEENINFYNMKQIYCKIYFVANLLVYNYPKIGVEDIDF